MKKVVLAGLLLGSFAAHAEPEASNRFDGGEWEFNISLSSIGFDSETAAQEFIDDKAFGLGLAADYKQNQWLSSVGIEIMFYDDNDGFSQTTTNQSGGNVQNSDSDASGTVLYGATGPLWTLGEKQDTFVYLQGGLSTVFGSERSIPNCSNCFSEDIDIDGGLFAKAGLIKNVGSSMALGVSLTQYLSGDGIDNNLSFILSSSF